MGRLRRFLSPQLADVVVDDESLLASHRREIVVVFCDMRGFTSFAEAAEPEEVMHVLGEYHLALGARIEEHGGTLERFTGDGVMVFFNDPVPVADPAGAAIGMSIAVRDDVRRLASGLGASGTRPRAGDRRRPGLRHAGEDRLPRSLRLRRHRQRHQPRGPPVRRGRLVAGAGDRPGAGAGRGPGGRRAGGRRAAQGLQPAGAGARRRGRDDREVGGWTDRRSLAELDEEQRYAVFDDLQQHLPHVWDAMRRDRPEESAVVVPSISLERTTASSGTLMQAMEERALFQLLLLRQPMLTLVYVTSSPIADEIIEYYLGLLPGVVPSQARRRLRLVSVGDASPRPLSEKVLGPTPGPAPDPRAHPRPVREPPDPLHDDRARAGRRDQPRHPDVRGGPAPRTARQQVGVPPAVRGGGRPGSGGRRGPPDGGRPRGLGDEDASRPARRRPR